jgi:hypothetical protein
MMRTISALAAATAILLAPASAPAQRYRESGTIRLETTEVALELEGVAKPPGD